MAFLWLINGGHPNYLLAGMILQVDVVQFRDVFIQSVPGSGVPFSLQPLDPLCQAAREGLLKWVVWDDDDHDDDDDDDD